MQHLKTFNSYKRIQMKYLGTETWNTTKDYFMIVIGLAMYAFGFCAFIFPEKIVIGGLPGAASLVYFATESWWGYGIPVGITNYVLNIALLCMAYKIVGKTFVIRTIFGSTGLSLFIYLFQPFFTEPFVEQATFMNVIIGAAFCGFGVGFAFAHNGSSGGSDIIAAMVSKKSNVTIGRVIMYTDMCIVSSSYLLFHSVDKIIYGFIVLFILTHMCDLVINSNRQAIQFTILSSKWEEIATAINQIAKRGCTVIDGKGWYTKHDIKILMVFCRRIESVTIFRIIKSIDKDAFVTQGQVNGVYGRGFDEVKVKLKKNKPGTITSPEETTAQTAAESVPQSQA